MPGGANSRRLIAVAALAAALSPGFGADAQPANTNDTEMLFLGTGGGPPLAANRSKPATLLIVDGRHYLIDCGMGTMQRLLQAGVDSQQIGTIFLTHLHADHDVGLVDVLANDYFVLSLRHAADKIAVYGPPQTRELVDAAFRFIAITVRPFAAENPSTYRSIGGQLTTPFVAHEFGSDGTVFQDDKIRVVAARNSHYALMPAEFRKTLQSYSYRIETPHGTLVFTGDTGPSEAVSKLAQRADVLVAEAAVRDDADREQFVEAMAKRNHWSAARVQSFRAHFQSEHLDTNEIGQLASRAHVGSVILYHYDPDDNPPHESYVRGVERHFAGPVFAPDDLDRFCMSSGKVHSCPLAERP